MGFAAGMPILAMTKVLPLVANRLEADFSKILAIGDPNPRVA